MTQRGGSLGRSKSVMPDVGISDRRITPPNRVGSPFEPSPAKCRHQGGDAGPSNYHVPIVTFSMVVTPMKKLKTRVGEERSHSKDETRGTQAHMTKGNNERRFLIPSPSMDISNTAILTPIKGRVALVGLDEPLGSPEDSETVPCGEESNHEKPMLSSSLGTKIVKEPRASVQVLLSSEEDIFEDAPESWTGQEDKLEVDPSISKAKMSNLLEDIDRLVDKERSTASSSEEVKLECERDIHELESRINLHTKSARKAVVSPGARFHIVLDSQDTPSRSNYKRSKGPTEYTNKKKNLLVDDSIGEKVDRASGRSLKPSILIPNGGVQ